MPPVSGPAVINPNQVQTMKCEAGLCGAGELIFNEN